MDAVNSGGGERRYDVTHHMHAIVPVAGATQPPGAAHARSTRTGIFDRFIHSRTYDDDRYSNIDGGDKNPKRIGLFVRVVEIVKNRKYIKIIITTKIYRIKLLSNVR